MHQRISGFHQDEEKHWVADLECGHRQHVRHDPPWMERPWVLTKEGRDAHLGNELNCIRCDEMGSRVAESVRAALQASLQSGYEQAGMSGLCDEGRFEAALSSLQMADLRSAIAAALKIHS